MSYARLTTNYGGRRRAHVKGCRSFCDTCYESMNVIQPKLDYYAMGWKRCKRCRRIFNTSDLYCACCGNRLSNKPGTSKARGKIQHARY